MRRFLVLALFALGALAPACNYRVTIGSHDGSVPSDGGSGSCGAGAACSAGNHCYCDRCISLDLPAPACDPPCSTARDGDFCTAEGNRCSGECSALVCSGGTYRREMGSCVDAGMCECPMPLPGCVYDGFPCPCTHSTCVRERCGRVTCGEGTTCCNASCGLCVPPGGSCIDSACAPDCTPQDAVGTGPCSETLEQWAWDGYACRELFGCSCSGADCASVFTNEMECLATFGTCGAFCGGIAGIPCRMGEYCDYASECHVPDGGGTCRPLPVLCPPVSHPVCGCDGLTYGSPCDAASVGQSVDHDGACAPDCSPEDAVPSGTCALVLGYRWTGTDCVAISGCSCSGVDCMRIAGRSQMECLAEHSGCVIPFP